VIANRIRVIGAGTRRVDGTYTRWAQGASTDSEVTYVQDNGGQHAVSLYLHDPLGPSWYVEQRDGGRGIYAARLPANAAAAGGVPRSGWEVCVPSYSSLPGVAPAPSVVAAAPPEELSTRHSSAEAQRARRLAAVLLRGCLHGVTMLCGLSCGQDRAALVWSTRTDERGACTRLRNDEASLAVADQSPDYTTPCAGGRSTGSGRSGGGIRAPVEEPDSNSWFSGSHSSLPAAGVASASRQGSLQSNLPVGLRRELGASNLRRKAEATAQARLRLLSSSHPTGSTDSAIPRDMYIPPLSATPKAQSKRRR